MSPSRAAFEESLRRGHDLVAVAKYLRLRQVLQEAAEDVLRAALAQSVGALDRYIHEIVRTGMLAAARGERSRTSSFNRFSVPLISALRGTEEGFSVDNWLNPSVVEKNESLSFQRAEKIADALRLVVDIEGGLWPAVAERIGLKDAKTVKERLDLIVDRRNAIVHEDDSDLSGSRSPIEEVLVTTSLDFLGAVVTAIDDICFLLSS